jgi:hypothetical protein
MYEMSSQNQSPSSSSHIVFIYHFERQSDVDHRLAGHLSHDATIISKKEVDLIIGNGENNFY